MTDPIVRASVDVRVETVIRRPVDEVAAYAADPSTAPEWYRNIESAQWRTPGPLAVGSRIAFLAKFLGRRLSYEYEVLEYVPGSRLVMRTAEGPFPMRTTYEWHAVGAESTRMVLRNDGEPTGFGRAVAPFVSAMMRRATRRDLADIKRILEGDAASRS